jgi:ribosomal-protein-alanine N-acetyltransferase
MRPLGPQDAADVFAYGRHPETTTFTLWDPHRTFADAKQFLLDCAQAREEGMPNPWGITLRESGQLIGTIGFSEFQLDHASGEVGYALGPAHWGRGYATEALRAVLDAGFELFDCNRIEARCVAAHAASARVMEKAGMTYEGTLRQALFLKGEYRDIKVYSALADDRTAQV